MNDEQINIEKVYQFMVDGFEKLSAKIGLVEERQKHFEGHFTREVDSLHKQGDQLERQIENVLIQLRDVSKRVDEVYDCRKQVSVSFTRNWAFASIFIALFSASFVLVVERIVL